MSLLETDELYVEYTSKKSVTGQEQIVRAVNGISLDIRRGEVLSVAGESGCGKSTLAKALMKLTEVKSGEIFFEGKNVINLKTKSELQDFYKKVQMIFQNPYSSLNPKMKIGQILSEPLEINTKLSKKQIAEIVEEKISQVGLDKSALNLYPHEFSGGQRQRIAIARALVSEPELIIADEPVSALDVSIQAQIINLIKYLKDNFNLTFLFISHDLSVIRYISDRIAIMYLGEIVELGLTEEIFQSPKHPYTVALLSAVPQINQNNKIQQVKLNGELPSPQNLPSGCKFHTRCPYAMDKCKMQVPEEKFFSDFHTCKCFLYP
ncbi:ATP-binding cassette domain-containing protein [bacterium]|nr:ATP-binding cassette domain-containing protein [bacterium]